MPVPGPTGTLEELLRPLKAEPERSAVLLDVDGVLAPIVQHPDDAHMPESTRRPLIEVARRYGTVACVSGRRASDARRIVSLGSIAYLGSHGSEVLMPGAIAPQLDRELQAWTRRVQNFAEDAFDERLRRLRVRLEDKEAIAALHWRGVPDEDDAEAAIREVAGRAEKAGFTTHWGRKVLEIRPPVRIDKGAGIVSLLSSEDCRRSTARTTGHAKSRFRRTPISKGEPTPASSSRSSASAFWPTRTLTSPSAATAGVPTSTSAVTRIPHVRIALRPIAHLTDSWKRPRPRTWEPASGRRRPILRWTGSRRRGRGSRAAAGPPDAP